ncbi:hypothetical protein HPC49_27280 [Pyxidicoccus fallax]|uniref:Cytochrome c-552/4 domain-containing protein n=1 Tax=Pyxidicoccus fallax TaxID=394095 RepID=A0A848LIG5_9BACT|nr:hypothetical protein [Pyxidicoccus fallax]NMO17512.1 hypothetical protein [Pyxidicoccus fallax]NPC81909.1 hypothetical protein [Pyxidicoccus fallax]
MLLSTPAAGADPLWGFGDFLGPAPVPHVSAETCEACHTEQHEAWSQSRHRGSVDNPVYLAGFAAEPHARCMYCHAPGPEQSKALLRQRATLVRERSLASVPKTSLAHEGISCVTCHLRGEEVLTPNAGTTSDAHPLRHAPAMAESSFCASCHEFLGHDVVDGRTVLNEERLQTTWSEWTAWRARGGEGTCQGCHMPGKAHTFRGAYDLDYLRGALSLRVEPARGRLVAVVESRGVGHSFPTGDVFRHLWLWADDRPVARFGQTFSLSFSEEGQARLRRSADTSLKPFEPARVELPAGTRRVRVTYHYARDGEVPESGPEAPGHIVELAALDIPPSTPPAPRRTR